MLGLSEARSAENRIYALYAKALVAFQLGGELLPLARAHALEALRLCTELPVLSTELETIQQELLDLIQKLPLIPE